LFGGGNLRVIPNMGKRFIYSPKHEDHLGPSWPPFQWVLVIKWLRYEADQSPQEVPWLRMSTAIFPLFHMHLWLAHWQLFHLNIGVNTLYAKPKAERATRMWKTHTVISNYCSSWLMDSDNILFKALQLERGIHRYFSRKGQYFGRWQYQSLWERKLMWTYV
jgi:hypothetical protein